MRILYLTADYGIPVLGNKGGAVHVRELSRAFRELGHELIALSPRIRSNEGNHAVFDLVQVGLPERMGSIVQRLKIREYGRFREEGGLHKEVRSLLANQSFHAGIMALHGQRPVDFIYERYSLWNYSGLEASRALGIPLVLEVNAPLTVEQEAYRRLHLKSLAQAIEEDLFGESDSIVAVSDEVRNYILGKGVPPDKVHTIPNSVDPSRFDPASLPDARGLRKDLDLPLDRVIVGFVGSLKKWHGIEVLIGAMERLSSASDEFHLVIVGDGPLRESLEARVADSGLSDSVTFTGEVTYERVPSHLKAMDLAVAPYIRIPDFYFSPLKLFEYMAMEKPVIASRIGQIERIVEDGKTGLLCRPGDPGDLSAKILAVSRDPKWMGRIGVEARKAILGGRSWTDNAREIISIAEERCAAYRDKMTVSGSPTS